MKKTLTDEELEKKLEILNYEKSELLVHLKHAEKYLKEIKDDLKKDNHNKSELLSHLKVAKGSLKLAKEGLKRNNEELSLINSSIENIINTSWKWHLSRQ